MGTSVPEALSFQFGCSWVDYIFHEMLISWPSLSYRGLRALRETWSRGKALSMRGRGSLPSSTTYSKQSEEKHVLPVTDPLSLCNKACLRPKLTFFPFRDFQLCCSFCFPELNKKIQMDAYPETLNTFQAHLKWDSKRRWQMITKAMCLTERAFAHPINCTKGGIRKCLLWSLLAYLFVWKPLNLSSQITT